MYQLQFVDKGNVDVKDMVEVQDTVRKSTIWPFPGRGVQANVAERQFNIKACHPRNTPIETILLDSTQTHAISIAKGRFIITS
jgi:hypothetical protein